MQILMHADLADRNVGSFVSSVSHVGLFMPITPLSYQQSCFLPQPETVFHFVDFLSIVSIICSTKHTTYNDNVYAFKSIAEEHSLVTPIFILMYLLSYGYKHLKQIVIYRATSLQSYVINMVLMIIERVKLPSLPGSLKVVT